MNTRLPVDGVRSQLAFDFGVATASPEPPFLEAQERAFILLCAEFGVVTPRVVR